MRILFLLIIFGNLALSEEYLKVLIFTKNKEFIKEYEKYIPEIYDFPLKEGFEILYPDGKPPLVYYFNEKEKNIIYEEKNFKKFNLKFKECEYLEEISSSFKFIPQNIPNGFPFDKNFYFILLKNSKELFLKENLYKIEELTGKYFYPDFIDFKKEKEVYLYPSFKSNIFIKDKKGENFENCKSKISLNIPSYGKYCKKYEEDLFLGGSNYNLKVPQNSNLKFKIYCEDAEFFSSSHSCREIGNPLIFNLNRLGKIEGKLLNKEEEPIKDHPLSIFYEDEKIPLKETITDENGYFIFKDLKAGKYFIKDSPEYEYFEGKNLDLKFDDETYGMVGKEGIIFKFGPGPKGTYFEEEIHLKEGEKKFLKLQFEKAKIWEGKVLSEENLPLPEVSIFYKQKEIGKTDGEGNFKVEVRENLLEKVIFSKEGYSPLILNNLEIKNAPEIFILKGLGKFKVKFFFENGIKPEAISNLTKEILFLKEETFEKKGMISLTMTQAEINLEAELEEGSYRFKIKGEFFKPFISSPFTIYSKKEYDYGTVKLEIKGEEKKEKRKIKILIKNPSGDPAPYATIMIAIISLPDKNYFTTGAETDEKGYYEFMPLYENFYYNFIYSESEEGFLLLLKKELINFDKLNYFELKLDPANYLKIKISKLQPEKDSYQILLRFKDGIIKDKISYGEEKIYKNLFSPVEIEILSEGEVIWKEVMELKEGENILNL